MENATLRPFRVRDPQWLVERHDTLYTRDEGFDESLSRQMARILEEFITDHDPRYEQGWIAEYQGGRLGRLLQRQAGCKFLEHLTAMHGGGGSKGRPA